MSSNNAMRLRLETACVHGRAFRGSIVDVSASNRPNTEELFEAAYDGVYAVLFQSYDQIKAELVDACFYIQPVGPVTMQVADLEQEIKAATNAEKLSVVDTTELGPYLIQPRRFGADIVVQGSSSFSETTHLGRASYDNQPCCVVALTQRGKEYVEKLDKELSGKVTLSHREFIEHTLRVSPLVDQKRSDNARGVASYLDAHWAVLHVFYPGLDSHGGFRLASHQMEHGFGPFLTFVVNGNNKHEVVIQAQIGIENINDIINELEVFLKNEENQNF